MAISIEKRNAAIPLEMRERKQWITWRFENGDKRPKGKWGDESHWKSFDQVSNAPLIGFVFSPDDPFTGVDLDDCIVDGSWAEWATQILDKLIGKAYGEISPSGKGIKFWTRARKPDWAQCTNKAGVECYDKKRWFAVTGDVIQFPGFDSIGDGQGAVDWICEKHLKADAKKTESKPVSTHTASPVTSGSESLLVRVKGYLDKCEKPLEGGRNNAIFSIAGHMFSFKDDNLEGLTELEVLDLLLPWNQGLNSPLGEAELRDCVKSAKNSRTPRPDKLPQPKADIRGILNQGERQSSSGEIQEVSEALLNPIAITDLVSDFPDMRPAVIDGALRRGETANIIASAKMGKSFLAGGLAWCIATGTPWLSHEVQKGRVLIIDNELHPETLASRLDAIANKMMIAPADRNDAIDVLPLRGVGLDIEKLGARLAIEPGRYALVIMDALYRFIPKGVSENDNASMMTIYNRLDEYAKTWDCAIAVIHHTSKGQQGEKAVTDVGSGAGSIARAADLHLVIRPHEQDGLAVLDFECRSWKRHEPVSIRYEYPLWHAVAAEAVVRKAKCGGDAQQAKKDEEADSTIRGKIENKWLSVAQLRRETGMGPDRITRSLHRIGAKSRRTRSKSTGKKAERFSLSDTPIGGEVVRKVERQNLQATGQ